MGNIRDEWKVPFSTQEICGPYHP